MAYAIRLKVISTKGLNSDALSLSFEVAGTKVTVQRENGEPLSGSGGSFIFSASGFHSADAAQAFGERLVVAVMLSSVSCGWSVDVGTNEASLQFSDHVIRAVETASGATYRPNVHGLDVFEESDNIFRVGLKAHATVSAAATALFNGISEFFDTALPQGAVEIAALRLLNDALMTDGAAKLVLSIAAVEALVPSMVWSSNQRAVLDHLITTATSYHSLSDDEVREVVTSLETLHRISVRQGIKRLLVRLERSELWTAWDGIYNERSSFFHGGSSLNRQELSDLAGRAFQTAEQIVMQAVCRAQDRS
jgi:hypothetical protein